jgi:hypothetical protein
MAEVSKMLRHSSIGTTVDSYHHLPEDSARMAPDAMGALLNQAFERTARGTRQHCDHKRFRRGERPVSNRRG